MISLLLLEHTPIQDTFTTKLHAKSCMTIEIPLVIYLLEFFLLPVSSDDGLGHYCTKTQSKQQANQLESLGKTEIQIITNRKHCLHNTILEEKAGGLKIVTLYVTKLIISLLIKKILWLQKKKKKENLSIQKCSSFS